MRRLFILSTLLVVASCAKYNRTQFVGTWNVEASLLPADDSTGIVITTLTTEEFKEDGAFIQTIFIKLNNGIFSIRRNTMCYGSWVVKGDNLNVILYSQRDDDGTTRELNTTEERNLVSISGKEIVYTLYNDSTNETNTHIMKKVEK